MQTAAERGASSLPPLPRFFSAHRRGAPKAERRRRKGKKVGIKRRRRRRRQRRRSEDKSPSQPRSLSSSSPPFLPTDRPEGVLASSLVVPGEARSGSGWDERVEENPCLFFGGGRRTGGRRQGEKLFLIHTWVGAPVSSRRSRIVRRN